MTNAWEKTGRDAADEDIAGGAEPRTTIAEARVRIGQWLRSQTPAVAAADAEACAAAYLRAWQAHARDTGAPPLDLDAVGERIAACVRLCDWQDGEGCDAPATQRCKVGDCELRLCDDHGPMHAIAMLHDTARLPRNAVPEATALLAEVRRLRGLLDAAAQALPAGYVAIPQELHDAACRLASDVPRLRREVDAARREGAEAMREAVIGVLATRAQWHEPAPRTETCDAIADEVRALPLPGGAL